MSETRTDKETLFSFVKKAEVGESRNTKTGESTMGGETKRK
jgi:hypothetical protein